MSELQMKFDSVREKTIKLRDRRDIKFTSTPKFSENKPYPIMEIQKPKNKSKRHRRISSKISSNFRDEIKDLVQLDNIDEELSIDEMSGLLPVITESDVLAK
jgi:hypothetical protein